MLKINKLLFFIFLVIPLFFLSVASCKAGDGDDFENSRKKAYSAYRSNPPVQQVSTSEEVGKKDDDSSETGTKSSSSSYQSVDFDPLDETVNNQSIAKITSGGFTKTCAQIVKGATVAAVVLTTGLVFSPFVTVGLDALNGTLNHTLSPLPENPVAYGLTIAAIETPPCLLLGYAGWNTLGSSLWDAAVSLKNRTVLNATLIVNKIRGCGQNHEEIGDDQPTDKSCGAFSRIRSKSCTYALMYFPLVDAMSGIYECGFYYLFIRTAESHNSSISPEERLAAGIGFGVLSIGPTLVLRFYNHGPHPHYIVSSEDVKLNYLINETRFLIKSGKITQEMFDLEKGWKKMILDQDQSNDLIKKALKIKLSDIISKAGDRSTKKCPVGWSWQHYESPLIAATLSDLVELGNFITMPWIYGFLQREMFQSWGVPKPAASYASYALMPFNYIFQYFLSLRGNAAAYKLFYHMLNPEYSLRYWVKSFVPYTFSVFYVALATYFYAWREAFLYEDQLSSEHYRVARMIAPVFFTLTMFARTSSLFMDMIDAAFDNFSEGDEDSQGSRKLGIATVKSSNDEDSGEDVDVVYGNSEDNWKVSVRLRKHLEGVNGIICQEYNQGIQYIGNPRFRKKSSELQYLMSEDESSGEDSGQGSKKKTQQQGYDFIPITGNGGGDGGGTTFPYTNINNQGETYNPYI